MERDEQTKESAFPAFNGCLGHVFEKRKHTSLNRELKIQDERAKGRETSHEKGEELGKKGRNLEKRNEPSLYPRRRATEHMKTSIGRTSLPLGVGP